MTREQITAEVREAIEQNNEGLLVLANMARLLRERTERLARLLANINEHFPADDADWWKTTPQDGV